MSVVAEFKRNFDLWAWMMVTIEDCPQSEVEELKQHIRSVWGDQEQKDYWIKRVEYEANEAMQLQQMAKGITQRIKDKGITA